MSGPSSARPRAGGSTEDPLPPAGRRVPSSLVLAAHGTRDPAGIAELGRLASLVALRLPGVAIRVGYVDVLGPSVSSVLSEVDGPVTLVPLFLASGYHVRVDIPASVAGAGRRDITVTAPLGPDPALIDVALDRLRAAGADPADAIVLAAAGSADPQAIADVERAAGLLGAPAGFIATASPAVAEVVQSVRARRGPGRIAVASWLLAPGFFYTQLAKAGADIVAEPLGAHPTVADLIVRRATAPLLTACGPAAGEP